MLEAQTTASGEDPLTHRTLCEKGPHTMHRIPRIGLFLSILLLSTMDAPAAEHAPDRAVKPTSEKVLERIPDKVVVLTFDDSVKSQFTMVRPILLKYRFGATFFVTEGFDFKTNKKDYMTWEQIAQLHKDGFEIGNHTRDHQGVTGVEGLREQVEGINLRCKEHGIPRPTSFAYPGNRFDLSALKLLRELGIQFARRGGTPEYPKENGNGFGYQGGLDHPLLIPSTGNARPEWTMKDFRRAIDQARHGRIAVLQFHGVPDRAHPWVHTPPEKFEQYMRVLATEGFQVLALRDVAKYVDPDVMPKDPELVIRDRQQALAAGKPHTNFRKPGGDEDLRYWLENMVWRHRYTVAEVSTATGMTPEAISAAMKKFDIRPETRPKRSPGDRLLVLPYPGGRHPRVGFLDGAIRPQRETKFSVFTPWDEESYFVVDAPEAIRQTNDRERGLLYLAHTHVPTMWSHRGVDLKPLEWKRHADGSLEIERRLPNGVTFGTKVVPGKTEVRMEMWLVNGSKETLTGLRVQNCIMLKEAKGFGQDIHEHKHLADPYAACSSASGERWIITAWTPCVRTWANPPCPCLHSDPQFPDCPPGETRRLRGWLSFYEGADIEAELKRIDATGWRTP